MGAASVKAAKGMKDVLPTGVEEHFLTGFWDKIIQVSTSVLEGHGFRRVLLPAVEETRLFARGIGEDTDIVGKEMFTFERSGDSLTLRPEGTAGAVRAFIEHNLDRIDPVQRWWYFGPMFRAERPQADRYRQFYQIGAEFFGVASPYADVELLLLLYQWCQKLGLDSVQVGINTVGDDESRKAYRDRLQAHWQAHQGELCDNCKRRMHTNPLRVLDCKADLASEALKTAPDIMEVLSDASRKHFEVVISELEALEVPHERDPRLVRGLDYYTGTVFELTAKGLGAQNAILGGGRYDNLVEDLGGSPVPAIGFAAGVERIARVLAQQKTRHPGPDLYIMPMPGTHRRALQLADEVRSFGMQVEVDVSEGRLKKQMKRADRQNAKAALVLGEDELVNGRAKLKYLDKSVENDVELHGKAICLALKEMV